MEAGKNAPVAETKVEAKATEAKVEAAPAEDEKSEEESIGMEGLFD